MAKGKKTGGRKPGSLNKATAEVKAAAQQYTAEAVRVLVQIMKTGKQEAARIAAARELLDRGHGRPRQTLRHEGDKPAALFVMTVTNRAELEDIRGEQQADLDAGEDDDDE